MKTVRELQIQKKIEKEKRNVHTAEDQEIANKARTRIKFLNTFNQPMARVANLRCDITNTIMKTFIEMQDEGKLEEAEEKLRTLYSLLILSGILSTKDFERYI